MRTFLQRFHFTAARLRAFGLSAFIGLATAISLPAATTTSPGKTIEQPKAEAAPAADDSAAGAKHVTGDEPLTADESNAVVIIEGDAGRGTGFIAKLRGQCFIVTNQHVLSGQTKFTATGLDGTKYPTNGDLYGAVDYDIAILHIPPAQHCLEILDKTNVVVKTDDAVTVPGNADGQSVVTEIHGKVLGVGPKLVEVDAKFIHGNSGSPIIHRDTEKVIGVATYAVTYKNLDDLKKAANAQETRWFGYRLDNIQRWEKLDWARFSQEGKKIEAIRQRTDAFITFLKADKIQKGDNAQINDAVEQFRRNVTAAQQHNNGGEVINSLQQFADQLRSLSDTDLKGLADRQLYSYHANLFKEQREVRAEIGKYMQDLQHNFNSLSR